jgi:hypothetical protein
MKYLPFACLLFAASPALAAPRPVLVEMFTSQSCSSCPPANALLLALAHQPGLNILPLSFDVTYWNDLGWHDSDSLDAATARQYWYASLSGSSEVYTPEAVVDGTAQMVGSNRAAVTAAIAAANTAGGVPVDITPGQTLTITIGAGHGAAQVMLFGYDPLHNTQVGGGENNGVMVTEVNVVRSITTLGNWQGAALTLHVPRPAGVHMAVILQTRTGDVLGVAYQ